MESIKYVGLFFDRNDILENAAKQAPERLHRVITHPHVTFAYRPAQIPWEAIGKHITLQVVGYGCNGKNEAFKVAFDELPEELTALAEKIAAPHITISVAKNAEPVDSANLRFTPIENFPLTGTFGYMSMDNRTHFNSKQ